MKQVTRIRVIKTAHDVKGRPAQFCGLVMSGATVVARTGNIGSEQICLCLAEALQTSYRVAQRSAHPQG